MSERLCVVVPVYNEADVLSEFHDRLGAALDSLTGLRAEIIYVNDGSRDGSGELLERLRGDDRRVSIIDLSRNYGKEIALTAGLDHAAADATVVIDADLQDPPELIPTLVERWRQGYDVVYAQRLDRRGESKVKKTTAALFYRLMQRVGRLHIPPNSGDFRLLSRRAVEAVCRLREQHRFMKGLFTWIGYPQTSVSYRRDPRHAGETKWSYWMLWNLALEGITSFTVTPLKLATYFGLAAAALAFSYGAVIIFKTILYGVDLPGYASLMVVVLFLGGVQLVALGIIGEYLGRMFNETKNRPLYFIQRRLPAGDAAAAAARATLPGDAEERC